MCFSLNNENNNFAIVRNENKYVSTASVSLFIDDGKRADTHSDLTLLLWNFSFVWSKNLSSVGVLEKTNLLRAVGSYYSTYCFPMDGKHGKT